MTAELLFALTLGATVLAGLVPAGVGAAEAGLTVFLTAVGVDASVAFTHRLCTRYLPPVLRYALLQWLTRKGYV